MEGEEKEEKVRWDGRYSHLESPFPRSRIEEAFMTGYRFMARLRRYYIVHWPFAEDKDGGW